MNKILLVAVALLFAIVLVPSCIGVTPGDLLHHVVLAAAAIPAVEPALFTVAEVCRILSIRPTTIYKLIALGELDARKVGCGTRGGRGTRITAESVRRLLAAAPKVEITGKSYLTLKTRRRLAREQQASGA
jgi:excisionase family DNA binding protein